MVALPDVVRPVVTTNRWHTKARHLLSVSPHSLPLFSNSFFSSTSFPVQVHLHALTLFLVNTLDCTNSQTTFTTNKHSLLLLTSCCLLVPVSKAIEYLICFCSDRTLRHLHWTQCYPCSQHHLFASRLFEQHPCYGGRHKGRERLYVREANREL